MSQPILVFDMDGVLADVTESYRETIARTAAHFTGVEIEPGRIQDYKNRGGFNDDWELTHRIIADAGVDAPFDEVVEHFQKLFLGDGTDGLILRERWVARPGVLEKINQRFRFAIFSGRPRAEIDLSLNRFAAGLVFAPIVGMFDVANHKPAPDGLVEIRKASADSKLYYIGDTPDDARCARAAGVPFIGVAAPSNRRYLDLVFLFQAEGAFAIVDDINYLEEVLPS
jgi:HAD superfamily phosphatase